MSEMLIERAWQIIGEATPIPADCGKLCGEACCKDYIGSACSGGENKEFEELGMLLFPGEEQLLRGEPGFKITHIRYMSGHAWFLVCSGICNRARRPLACRIFPLAPDIGADGSLRVLPDPRATRMCPLTVGNFIDRRFRGAVARALRMLARDTKCLEFMRLLSSELAELRRLTGLNQRLTNSKTQ